MYSPVPSWGNMGTGDNKRVGWKWSLAPGVVLSISKSSQCTVWLFCDYKIDTFKYKSNISGKQSAQEESLKGIEAGNNNHFVMFHHLPSWLLGFTVIFCKLGFVEAICNFRIGIRIAFNTLVITRIVVTWLEYPIFTFKLSTSNLICTVLFYKLRRAMRVRTATMPVRCILWSRSVSHAEF